MAHMTSTGNSMRNHIGYPGLSVESISPVTFRNACGMFGTGVTVIVTVAGALTRRPSVVVKVSESVPENPGAGT